MSDIDDYDDDLDFDALDWFYVEEPDDEVGDLAEHAIASPPPIEYVDDNDDWDRFEYWNDLEYDSDAYNDVERTRRKEEKLGLDVRRATKRKAGGDVDGPNKRLRAPPSKANGVVSAASDAVLSPVMWRSTDREAEKPLFTGQSNGFALLQDWRTRFSPINAEGTVCKEPVTENARELGIEDVQIDPSMLRAALQSNLAKLTGSSGSGGAKETMLLDYVAKMLSGGGSADDIAGELADALFSKEGESTDNESEGGDFGQWVLGRAEEQAREGTFKAAGPTGELSPARSHKAASPQDHMDIDEHKDPTVLATPTDRRPPTPASAQMSSSNETPEKEKESADRSGVQKLGSKPKIPAAVPQSTVSGKKRKASDTNETLEDTAAARSKRVATRSFDAPTASSRAKSAAAAPSQREHVTKSKARQASRGTSVQK